MYMGHLELHLCNIHRSYVVIPVLKGQSDEGTFSQNGVLYLPHGKEAATKGHLSCRDTFFLRYRCALKTGFTVCRTEDLLYFIGIK